MFDVYIGGINLTLLIIVFSILLIFPCQLLLCFKVKSLFPKLIPSVVFAFCIALFCVLAYTAMDWSGLFYIVCAVYSGMLLLMCIIGWAVFGIMEFIKDHKTKYPNTNDQ